MRRAVFLDRDGTIIRQVNDLRRMRDMRLLPGAAEAIRKFNKMGLLVLVHTNQPVIARGWLSEEKLKLMHEALCERLKKKGAHIDAIYYCPHHPNANLKEYRMVCSCRKPRTGMFRKAAKRFSINLKKSYVIGDHTRDILAGHRAGMKTILVKTGEAGRDGKYDIEADFVVKNLYRAAMIIKKDSRN
ncbi:MAG: HAD family hydrolase [Parcubacteria group bacterium]|nr:HAD family hydrolase [Parcubacteria group bacterium]